MFSLYDEASPDDRGFGAVADGVLLGVLVSGTRRRSERTLDAIAATMAGESLSAEQGRDEGGQRS